MVVRQAFAATRAALRAAGIEEDAPEADLLLRLATGRGHLEQDTERELTGQEIKKLDELTRRRCTRYPAQYLAGSWPFYGLELAVGEGVLIPRPDTELAAQLAIDAARRAAACHPGRAVRAADLCAGTGALGLALARHVPGARVTAVELSGAAFAYLEKNNAACGGPLVLVQADALAWCPPEPLDVVVSNPPYVTAAEYDALAPELY
ncbi:MAG TPA: peptide chain release factor N(5)-glutamine methyltransferase, partial [Candidatus Pygmaiobacter gallistercoris]|nr:peptide chain release factor N(5)-glutamine methyltransferase [Candidatus Pygmaiobacter gallistercoris]